MKEGIHPDYHDVIFVDSATGSEWTSRSTMTSKETRDVDGAPTELPSYFGDLVNEADFSEIARTPNPHLRRTP